MEEKPARWETEETPVLKGCGTEFVISDREMLLELIERNEKYLNHRSI
jgi:hypothetical protein